MTIAEIAAVYMKHAKAYYVKGGEPTAEVHCIQSALLRLLPLYRRMPAVEFGPLALKAVRQRMVDDGCSRNFANKAVARIKRMFRWAAAQELIGVEVHQRLATVDGLREGKTTAKELPPILPVSPAAVEQTLPHLCDEVADMVRFHRLTGCRPGELVTMRPADVDRSSDVWRYTVPNHKMSHTGRERVVYIGPKAQAILTPFLLRGARDFCFLAKRRGTRRQALDYYRQHIRVGCELAFGMPDQLRYIDRNHELATEERSKLQAQAAAWRAKFCWSPNQLRHAAATEIRRAHGLEAAQVLLGHSRADVTQIYAERNSELAETVAAKIG